MARTIEFHFDFSSPHAYLASTRIDALAAAHNAAADWRPFLLGAVMKVTGVLPPSTVPLKGSYDEHDVARRARRYGVPFKMPEQFPFGTVTACRAFYFLKRDQPARAVTLAKALFNAAFAEGRDISSIETLTAVAEDAGFEGEAIQRGIQTQQSRAHLRGVVDEATARGVFGSPFFFAEGEPFWGEDRLEEALLWLDRGGW
jgi:2-hydroxychromene-2-carboxylate isomerase